MIPNVCICCRGPDPAPARPEDQEFVDWSSKKEGNLNYENYSLHSKVAVVGYTAHLKLAMITERYACPHEKGAEPEDDAPAARAAELPNEETRRRGDAEYVAPLRVHVHDTAAARDD
eukprot:918804-Prorocentrum_minimum.AAC.1